MNFMVSMMAFEQEDRYGKHLDVLQPLVSDLLIQDAEQPLRGLHLREHSVPMLVPEPHCF